MTDTKNTDLLARREAAVSNGVGLMHPVFAQRAENSEIWDVDGKRFIDFAAGIAVTNCGHRHPAMVAAVAEQLAAFTHTCQHVAPYENMIELAERLNEIVPGDGPMKSAFFTSGAEAVENAVKLARAFTGRDGVIAFGGGFHGRTFMGMSLTGKVAPYKAGFGAMMSDVYHVPMPKALSGTNEDTAMAGLKALFKESIEPSRIAAIIIEPVQGEGGFYQAPDTLLVGLRELCDAHGILLIADEVQTGFARTGKMFAMEHSGINADLTAMAKGLAGGMPLSAVTGRAAIMDYVGPGSIGGTYGGNPLAVAASLAVLDIIEKEGLCERATMLGEALSARLNAMRAQVPEIAEVRGPGFMVAVEFRDPVTGAPLGAMANAVKDGARERGMLLLTCGTDGNVVRFLAPLTIPQDHFDEAMAILEASILAASGKYDA
ncbi:4-aminobutyrate aminotransferase apoenzyme [Octadecabacter temperatus]|uniref:4-aminobutyrate aminotransferase PuuE n=1 Tax=Octadecabacter temperatus TaxID=1458307 RepID=A0A0K0Y5B2_9RHOB|nr:4-aminobutyrate--2-oxoglutarate transaminase [Octadecabacter temperatus]AKS46135.1 4-aminobutyrate aminotransferase PuuE [Octadecabacter temperatus]SIO08188.1 4-aminobutyrate aminotransferase apoenzyme [Octadecabacter temperatus]